MHIDGNAIVERIDGLLEERREKRAILCKAVGINPGAVTNWCGKKQSLPRADIALAIADYLGVTIRWLLTGQDERGISREERNLLVKFECLTDDNKRNVLVLIDSMLQGVPGILGEAIGSDGEAEAV